MSEPVDMAGGGLVGGDDGFAEGGRVGRGTRALRGLLERHGFTEPAFHGTVDGKLRPSEGGLFLPGTHFGTERAANERLEHLLAEPEEAREIGRPARGRELPAVYPAQIKPGRTAEVSDNLAWYEENVADDLLRRGLLRGSDLPADLAGWDWQEALRGRGYDTLWYRNEQEDPGSRSWLLLNPDNARPLLGRGSRYADGGVVGEEEEEAFAEGGRVVRLAAGLGEAIRAYHGSPHRFDRFDISRIGSGEGAQVYGHGLYFTEREGIADHYRRTLTRDQARQPAPVLFDGEDLTKAKLRTRLNDELHDFYRSGTGDDASEDYQRLRVLTRFNWDSPEAMAFAREYLERHAEHEREFTRTGVHPRGTGFSFGKTQGEPEYYERQLAWLDANAHRFTLPERPGATYEVRLHMDRDRLLDWDKRLPEQPEAVRETVVGLAPPRLRADLHAAPEEFSGRDVYRALGLGPRGGRSGAPERAAAMLDEAGIPGVRYLDGTSRRAGEGTSNFVAFDDAPVEIVRRYQDGGLVE